MRKVLLGCLLGLTLSAAAGELPVPPPLQDQPVSLQKYLKTIYNNWMNAPHYSTGNPNAVRNGTPGDVLWATFGGSDRICLCTGSGPGASTAWKCVVVS